MLDLAEAQTEPIASEPDRGGGNFPLLNCVSIAKERSRQLWAFFGPLVAGDLKNASIYDNVPRHNGPKAWRRIAEPTHEEQLLILQDLLPAVTNSRAAVDMAGYSSALEDWETNSRLFTTAGGVAPTGGAERLAFVKLLPPDVAAHDKLHIDLPAYREFSVLKKLGSKYV